MAFMYEKQGPYNPSDDDKNIETKYASLVKKPAKKYHPSIRKNLLIY
jgi:hypothetical protein